MFQNEEKQKLHRLHPFMSFLANLDFSRLIPLIFFSFNVSVKRLALMSETRVRFQPQVSPG